MPKVIITTQPLYSLVVATGGMLGNAGLLPALHTIAAWMQACIFVFVG